MSGNWARMVGSRSIRQAWSTAASAACSVSPRGVAVVLMGFCLHGVAASAGVAQQLVVGGDRGQRPGVGRQCGQPPFGQRRHVPRPASPPRRCGGRPAGSVVVGLGGLAGLQRDRVRGQRPGPQRGGQPGDDVLVGHVPVQQQHLDQGPGAGRVAVGLAGRRPPGVVDRGELARRAGLFQRGRARERAGFADQASR